MKTSGGFTTMLVAALILAGCSNDEASDQAAKLDSTSTTSTATPQTTTSTSAPAPTEAPTTAAPTTPEPAPPPAPTAAPTTTVDREGPEFALQFYKSTESRCAEHADRTGNSRVPPEYFAGASVVGPKGDGIWQIVDGNGNGLIVEATEGVVYGLDGWDGELPILYSFGCAPDLYLGGVSE